MNILITGGTGSLGQELTKQLLERGEFDRICIYSRGEHKQEEMQRRFNDSRLRFFIGDVRDKDRLSLAINGRITHIINAAALKVVPTAEFNPFEALKTNVIGAQNIIDCALNSNYCNPYVLQISTDKCVRPINLYGATKLVAEKLFIAANNIKGEEGPRFSVVRYGNVFGSNGSIFPLFKKQKDNNEPLTVTDDRMTRFFITVEKAAEFIIGCLFSMNGGEIFIPEMPSFKVIDLAEVMQTSGIKIIGIRQGEKLHEDISYELSSDKNDWWLTKEDLKRLVGL